MQYIPEHSDLLTCIAEAPEHSYFDSQKKFLLTERIRLTMVTGSSATLLLMDRSFVSIFAHTIATKPRSSAARHSVLEELFELIKSRLLSIPHCFVFLDVAYSTSLSRFYTNRWEKGTDLALIAKPYFHRLRRIYTRWISLVEGHLLLSPGRFDISRLTLRYYNPGALIQALQTISQEED